MKNSYNIFMDCNGHKYRETTLDFFCKQYGNELVNMPIKQIFKPSIKIKPFAYNGKKVDKISEIIYIFRQDDSINFFEAVYPMNYSDMVKSSTLDSIVLHHMGNSYSMPKLLGLHMNYYSAIGYHYIIQDDGSIILTRSLDYQGAHVGKETNIGKIGISFCANLDYSKLNDKMTDSCKRLVNYLMKKYDIDKNNISLHREVQIRKINEFLYGRGFNGFVNEKIMREIKSKEEYKNKKRGVVSKIFEKNLDEKTHLEVSKMIKGLTTCPGIKFDFESFGW